MPNAVEQVPLTQFGARDGHFAVSLHAMRLHVLGGPAMQASAVSQSVSAAHGIFSHA